MMVGATLNVVSFSFSEAEGVSFGFSLRSRDSAASHLSVSLLAFVAHLAVVPHPL